CDGLDNDCDGFADYVTTADDGGGETDGDGDGVIDCLDCADTEPLVFPDATETCDGIDQDCDGLTDENFDVDVDSVTTCGPDGLDGTEDDDCDDNDATVSPLVTETCDGVDQDCDGAEAALGSGPLCEASSCNQVVADGYSVGDGVYWINPDGAGSFPVHCDMTTDGGGWTMILMVDSGDIDTFRYDSSYWTSTALLNETITNPAINDNMKNQAYNNLSFTEIRFDMASLGNSHTITHPSTSALAVFTGPHVDPGLSRADYLDWIPEANSEWDNQLNCNTKGFQVSVSQGNCRYGISMNNENECNSNDSAVGFGCHTNNYFANRTTACGGHRWSPDVAYPYKGWIFVR
ncbi:MAG TPA: hypothetical protein DIU15_17425, partial [Deltaproteobacteria bacterium]|nr:hypothetical protein [Deltaproteobacteria bacterium]